MSVQVNCKICGEELDEPGYCSYFISKPITLAKVESLFPFEGTFHFRIRVTSEHVDGIAGEYFWMDMVDKREDFERFCTVDADSIDVQALVMCLPENSDADSGFDLYLDQAEANLPSPRPTRCIVERNSTTKQSVKSKLDGVAQKIASTAATAANLKSLHTVKLGASNLWNSVLNTASHIQQSLSAQGSRDGVSESVLSLHADINCIFDPRNIAHSTLLSDLWSVLFPGVPYERESARWKEAGWQSTDVPHELKTSGLLAVKGLVYFGKAMPIKFHDMVLSNKDNTKMKYPLAIVGVNLTLMLIELLKLRDSAAHSLTLNWELLDHPNSYYELFMMCFVHIDSTWTQRKASRAEFGKIIGDVKGLVSSVLGKMPRSVEEFKFVAIREGLQTVP